MSTPVTLPALGESITEGTVTQWLKQEGDTVEADEPLLEVSTDKVDTEIPAPVSGVLTKILVGEDETVEVGAEIAMIGSADEAGAPAAKPATETTPKPAAQPEPEPEPAARPEPEPSPAAETRPEPRPTPEPQPAAQQPERRPEPEAATAQADLSAPARQAPRSREDSIPSVDFGTVGGTTHAPERPAPAPQRAPDTERPAATSAPSGTAEGAEGYVTPLVRKLAAEQGVDLSTVQGTGVGGRIRKQDVQEAARRAAQQRTAPQPAAAGGTDASLRGRTEKMSRQRQTIAQNVVESMRTSAQLTQVMEVDVTRVADLYKRANAGFEAREGARLSFFPFFALATVEALKVHPKLNAAIDNSTMEVTYHAVENLSITVDTDRGLLAAVVKDAGDLNLGGLARKITDLATRTRSGELHPEELSGGTFTLTNTGWVGALFDTPIINQPQVAALSIGRVTKRPVVVVDPHLGEVMAVRSMVYLALSYDQRLIDGDDAARFLRTVRERLEEGSFEAEVGMG